jgi:hypothetical protein
VSRPAPFPFITRFQNGPRREGCGPFPRLSNEKGRGANAKSKLFTARSFCGLLLVGLELSEKLGVDKTS